MRYSKIVCTIGPATSSAEKIEELINSGMNVARLNFSHGEHEDHKKIFNTIKEVSKRLNKHIGILMDLQGPKIRTSKFTDDNGLEIKCGEKVIISVDNEIENSNLKNIVTSYKYMIKDVEIGHTILIDDGLIELKVAEKKDNYIVCDVIAGGSVKNRKGINLPDSDVTEKAITEKDKKDLKFGLSLGVNFVALSFVRSKNDILELKELIAKENKSVVIIAKLEKPEALKNIDEILDEVDGIMIARGDLAVEVNQERLPVIQKKLILRAKLKNRFVITATQMLDSMIHNKRPTRAEITDVANAILDGTDAVMLSGETASGKYPVHTVKTMVKIIEEAEKASYFKQNILHGTKANENFPIEDTISNAVYNASKLLNAKAIVAYTNSGNTAKFISNYKPETPIYALCPYDNGCEVSAMYWGVTPIKIDIFKTSDEMFNESKEILKKMKKIEKDDIIIMTAGIPLNEKGSTNMMKIEKI